MKYRSRIDIAADILELALNGEAKTRLIYRASLSHQQLQEYLELLTSGGLLKYVDEDRKLYQTAEKGRYFLEITITLASNKIHNEIAMPAGQTPIQCMYCI